MHYKQDEVVAIVNEEGLFHVNCYDGDIDDIRIHNILTVTELVHEDWYFCKKCGKQIYY